MMSMSKMSKLSKLNHAAGIYADMSVDGPAIGTLVAVVDRAKNLPNRKTMGKQNPYCAARLGKEAKKTDTDLRGGQTPKWDQELRFTVHESPDYFRLKLSVFNDDKRTDLIGETWVDLKDLIIPGGGQSDQWHPLQFRGKYAGEIRIEMTYYDTRPEDEAVIERRTQAAEKVHAKPSGSGSTPVNSSSLSGPRQLKDVKRRPLPSDPPGAPPRPTLPEKTASAPLPQQPPSRPVHHEPAPSAPPAPSDYAHHSRHPVAPEMPPYDAPSYAPPPAARPMRNYETPDDFHREWSQPVAPPPLSASKRIAQDPYYPSYREKPMDAYDSRSYTRPRSGYGNMPPADYRSSRSDLPVTRADHYAPEPIEAPPVEAPRPSSHHSNYQFPTVEPYPPSSEILPHGHGSRYRPRSSGGMQEPPLEYSQHPGQHPGPVERDHYYRPHSNSLVHDPTPMRPPPSRDGYHTEYATMQPRVEDEEDEGPPPPPPVHRSGVGHSSQHSSQQLVPSPTSPYQAYSPEYGSPHTSREIPMTHPSHPPTDGAWMHDMPTSTPSMPPSLVAGFDPIVADAESDRAVAESHSRRQSAIFEGQVMPLREPSPILPPYPVDPAPEDRASVSRGSMNSETRIVPRKSVSPGPSAAIHRKSVSPGPSALVPRKSISPRPSSSGGREPSQVPFSPDSFDAFNPNAARSAVFREPAPAYDSPAQAMEAARRSEAEAARDPGPIYDDEGKEIDPSDHLPTDTWAPEPERKTKKPGVVVRFRNAPARTATKPPVPAKEWGPPRGRPATMGTTRRPQSYGMPDMMRGRPPPSEMHRGRDPYGSYAHGRTYSTPNVAAPSPQSSFRGSTSPGRSPSRLYEPENPGPPIPAKVPIAPPPTQSFPVSGSRGGMDALSRELGTIDIGSVGCNNGRAVRRYVPKITTGYAS